MLKEFAEIQKTEQAIRGPQFDRKRHGSLFDRGSADSYYSRPQDPHWFPDSADQVLQMSPQDLRRQIQDLHSDKGNNPFLNQKLDPNNIFEFNQFFSDFERDFIQTYIKPTQIG
jgi:hypothetical protein